MSSPSESGYALFDTAIGRCGIGWTAAGIAAVQLPEATAGRARARLRRRLPDAVECAPPALADRIIALLAGSREDLSDVVLDLSGVPAWHQQVYRAARTVLAGSTVTYGAIADLVGPPVSPRDVGQALGRNPFPIIVPCHRVVAANGRTGGFSATGGVSTKLAMLAAEGVAPKTHPRSDRLRTTQDTLW